MLSNAFMLKYAQNLVVIRDYHHKRVEISIFKLDFTNFDKFRIIERNILNTKCPFYIYKLCT